MIATEKNVTNVNARSWRFRSTASSEVLRSIGPSGAPGADGVARHRRRWSRSLPSLRPARTGRPCSPRIPHQSHGSGSGIRLPDLVVTREERLILRVEAIIIDPDRSLITEGIPEFDSSC
jgi:hypothetical protein